MLTTNSGVIRCCMVVCLSLAAGACGTPVEDDRPRATKGGSGGRAGSSGGSGGDTGNLGTGGMSTSIRPPETVPAATDARPSQPDDPLPHDPSDAATMTTPDGGPPVEGVGTPVNLIVRNDTLKCLDVVDFPKDMILRTTSCSDRALGQTFLVTDDGRYTFPSHGFTLEDRYIAAGSYCLTADRNPYPQATSTAGPSLALCDANDPAQRWGKPNPTIVSKKTSQCLGVSAVASGTGHLVSLQDCQSGLAAAQEWIAGSPKQVSAKPVALISNRDSNSCLHVHEFSTERSLRWHVCSEREFAQKFLVEPGGRIRFPALGSVKVGAMDYAVGSLCVTRTGAADLSLEPCAPNNGAQDWARQGATFAAANGMCLTRSDGSEHLVSAFELPKVATAPCSPDNPLQSWTVGSWLAKERERVAAVKAAAMPMSLACKAPPVIKIIDRDNNGPAVQRVTRLYGGPAGLKAHLAKTFETVCNTYYERPEDVPLRTELHVVFWPTTSGMMVCTRVGGTVSINVNDAAVNADRSTDAAFRKYLDGVWHHETGHSLQYGNGLPGGLVEGMADWTVLEHFMGLPNRGVRSAGGNWTDGYERTAYFYDWLGKTYPSSTDKRKFAARLNTAVLEKDLAGEVWNLQWFVEQTGKTVDQLWTQYQATLK